MLILYQPFTLFLTPQKFKYISIKFYQSKYNYEKNSFSAYA
jgi:hypothetical protein